MRNGMQDIDLSGIRGILFDKDGTLIDFQKSWGPPLRVAMLDAARGDATLARQLLIRGGMDPDTGITRADSLFAAAHTREIAAGLVEAGAAFDLDALTLMLDAHFVRAADHGVPVTDLAALFRTLRERGLEIGIASSDSEEAVWRTLQRFRADRLVHFVAGYDSGHGAKPAPGMFHAFCEARGLAPHEVAMVGDNLHDMDMGRAGGAGACIAVLTGTGTPETLRKSSDMLLDSDADLPTLLG